MVVRAGHFGPGGGLPPVVVGRFFPQLCYSSVATEGMSSVATEHMSSVATEDMSSVATEDLSSVATEVSEDKSSVATEDIFGTCCSSKLNLW